MKKLLCSLLLAISTHLAFSQLEINDQISDLNLIDIYGDSINVKSEGILVLDFWATSCGPCIPGLEKLSKIHDEYPGQIQVVAISHEPADRIRRFQSKKQLNIQYSSDTAQRIQEFFPHRIIPHSVVVRNGKILAITNGSNLTPDYFNSLISGDEQALPEKRDDMSDQLFGPYFNIPDDHGAYFDIQPGLKGKSTFSQQFSKGPFAGRRIRCMNMTIDGLFRLAYQTTSYRMKVDADSTLFTYDNIHNLYCVDFVVEENEKDLLHHKFQQTLEDNFSYNVAWKKLARKVVVLRTSADSIPMVKADLPSKLFEAGGSHYKGRSTIAEFAKYLEGFGIVGYAVEDDTGSEIVYDIDFSFYPEDPKTFHDALARMGLAVTLEQREINILVIGDKSQP